MCGWMGGGGEGVVWGKVLGTVRGQGSVGEGNEGMSDSWGRREGLDPGPEISLAHMHRASGFLCWTSGFHIYWPIFNMGEM